MGERSTARAGPRPASWSTACVSIRQRRQRLLQDALTLQGFLDARFFRERAGDRCRERQRQGERRRTKRKRRRPRPQDLQALHDGERDGAAAAEAAGAGRRDRRTSCCTSTAASPRGTKLLREVELARSAGPRVRRQVPRRERCSAPSTRPRPRAHRRPADERSRSSSSTRVALHAIKKPRRGAPSDRSVKSSSAAATSPVERRPLPARAAAEQGAVHRRGRPVQGLREAHRRHAAAGARRLPVGADALLEVIFRFCLHRRLIDRRGERSLRPDAGRQRVRPRGRSASRSR